jgi:glycosyltransferase involved in cell wall biosynthesis
MEPTDMALDRSHEDGSKVDVSIVLPVYNESGHLTDEIKRIRASMDASEYSYEIIVVDDGSTDDSMTELRSLDGFRLVQFAQNRGSGAARRAGTALARGDIVVWTDADMSYPNDTIPQLLDEMPGWDMVVGARRTEAGTHKFLRVPAKWLIRMLASFLTATKIPDLNSGFRAFRRVVAMQYLHLLPVGFSCVTTITMSFLSNHYSVKYVDIDYAERAGRSKFHPWIDTRRYVRQVIRMILLFNPMRFFLPIAVTFAVAGAGKVLYDLVTKDLRIATNTIVIVAVAAGFGLLGLLADLLVHLNRNRETVLPAASYDSLDTPR